MLAKLPITADLRSAIHTKKKDRIKDQKYLYKGIIRIWNGKILLCEHGKQKATCTHKDCVKNATNKLFFDFKKIYLNNINEQKLF